MESTEKEVTDTFFFNLMFVFWKIFVNLSSFPCTSFFFFSFIHMWIHCLGHFSPLPLHLLSGRIIFDVRCSATAKSKEIVVEADLGGGKVKGR
jgi:hypothetical protein